MGLGVILALAFSITSVCSVFAGYSYYTAELHCGLTLALPEYDSPLIVIKSKDDKPSVQENCNLYFKPNKPEYGIVAWMKDINLRTDCLGCIDYVQIEYDNGKKSNQICMKSQEEYISPPHMKNEFKVTFHKNFTNSAYEGNLNESDFNFHLVLTQFTQGSCNPRNDFLCVTEGRCISKLLRCDKINNCGDNSDEGCPDSYSTNFSFPVVVSYLTIMITLLIVFICIAKLAKTKPIYEIEPIAKYTPIISSSELPSYGAVSGPVSRQSSDISELDEETCYQRI